MIQYLYLRSDMNYSLKTGLCGPCVDCVEANTSRSGRNTAYICSRNKLIQFQIIFHSRMPGVTEVIDSVFYRVVQADSFRLPMSVKELKIFTEKIVRDALVLFANKVSCMVLRMNRIP